VTVKVYFFGHFRDIHPDGLIVDVPVGSTVADLARLLISNDPRLEAVQRICRAAVNEEYVAAGLQLSPDDTVAFIPPMSGGSSEG
jgi:molybdopterin converting factor small subunit